MSSSTETFYHMLSTGLGLRETENRPNMTGNIDLDVKDKYKQLGIS